MQARLSLSVAALMLAGDVVAAPSLANMPESTANSHHRALPARGPAAQKSLDLAQWQSVEEAGPHIVIGQAGEPRFAFYFGDVANDTDRGLDHPELGHARRAEFERAAQAFAEQFDGTAFQRPLQVYVEAAKPLDNFLANANYWFDCSGGAAVLYPPYAAHTGIDPQPSHPDLWIELDNKARWTVDGPAGSQLSYDLAGLMLHELGHGLGFGGPPINSDTGATQACLGNAGPNIGAYRARLEDGQGNPVYDEHGQFIGDRDELGDQQAGWLVDAGMGLLIDMASIYHAHPSYGEAALMTPLIDPGELALEFGADERAVLRSVADLRADNDVPLRIDAALGLAGSWFDPTSSGQGFAFDVGETAAGATYLQAYYYGYGESGRRLWAVSEPTLLAQDLRFGDEIMLDFLSAQPDGGQFEQPVPPSELAEFGELRLRLQTCDALTATFATPLGTQEYELSRITRIGGAYCRAWLNKVGKAGLVAQNLPQPPDPGQGFAPLSALSGNWFDPSRDGQGLAFEVMHTNGDYLLQVYYYGYDNDGEPLWAISQPKILSRLLFEEPLTLEFVAALDHNGGFGAPQDPGALQAFGELTIEFDDCDSAQANFDTVIGEQTLELERLTRMLACE